MICCKVIIAVCFPFIAVIHKGLLFFSSSSLEAFSGSSLEQKFLYLLFAAVGLVLAWLVLALNSNLVWCKIS